VRDDDAAALRDVLDALRTCADMLGRVWPRNRLGTGVALLVGDVERAIEKQVAMVDRERVKA